MQHCEQLYLHITSPMTHTKCTDSSAVFFIVGQLHDGSNSRTDMLVIAVLTWSHINTHN